MSAVGDFAESNADSLAAWSANAAYWDGVQGDEGNFWQRELVFPPTFELLEPLPERLLELACGNGNFARAAAARGVQVVATDGSPEMLAAACARSGETGGRIRWHPADATDSAQLAQIPGGPFDAAVCNMALMDIAALDPLFAALSQLLAPGAPFVFSVLHPAFNSGPTKSLFIERRETADGEFAYERGVRVSTYLTPQRLDGVAVVGQPVLQPYFHRPLEALLGAAFTHGWALDGLREPSFADNPDPDDSDRFTWDDLPEIPPVLVARLRYLG